MTIVKGRHALVGSITSNSWLVLSSSVHCVSVVSVAVYCQIEWGISQPQLALAFQLAQIRVLVFMLAGDVGTVMAENPVFLIVARLFITHGKDIYLQSLNNPSKSRLALRFENPIFTTFHTAIFVHHCRVAGNALIQRTRSFYH